MWFYGSIKTIKAALKFFFSVCRINFRIQHLACSLISHCVIILHNIFWRPFHASFLNVSSISLWSYTCWSIICYFWSLSRHAIQARVSEPKIIFLYPLMVSLMASSSSSFVFIQFRRGLFNFFASSNRDVLLIYFIDFVTQGRLQKSFLIFFLLLEKSIIIIITQHVALLFFCIGVFALFNICLRMIIFTLFVDRINL